MKNTNSLYISLVSGFIGLVIGISSTMAVQATIIRRGFLEHGAAQQENVLHEVQADGEKNFIERKAAKRADVVYPTKTLP